MSPLQATGSKDEANNVLYAETSSLKNMDCFLLNNIAYFILSCGR